MIHVTFPCRSTMVMALAAACSAVANDIKPNTVVSGTPALPHRQNLREQAALRRLPALLDEMRKLQEEIKKFKEKYGDAE